ncbi:hypothetical protein BJX99DRAFT_109743 [Aspergillus californicus]
MFSSTSFGQFEIQSSMFAQPSKRQRDQEEPTSSYNEDLVRERKKHRPLPLRSPPKSSQRSNSIGTHPQTPLLALTPVESSEDEDDINKRFRTNRTAIKAQQPLQNSRLPVYDLDTSMDIDSSGDGISMDDNCNTPRLLSAPPTSTCQSINTGHYATTFPKSTVVDLRGSPAPPHALSQDTRWWHSPRLPSPVSDNGDAMTRNKDAPADTEMTYDLGPSDSIPSASLSVVDAEAADMRKRLSSLDLPDQENAGPPFKPTKKLAFSMGYRADCDKCQRRIPGHYSHIIG